MIRIETVVQRIKRGWQWLVQGPERLERQMEAFVLDDEVEIRYRIGGHLYLFRYHAESYENARGMAVMQAREPGPFDHIDAEAVVELMYTIAQWSPKRAAAV